VLFAASGDIRHIFECEESMRLLLDKVDTINIHFNDLDKMVSVRNVMILYLLLTKGEEGIDTAINLWYSQAMTASQALGIKYDLM